MIRFVLRLLEWLSGGDATLWSAIQDAELRGDL